jgi:hypothetical protein
VLALIPKRGGRVIERVRAELPDDDALADKYAQAIARTEVLHVGSVLRPASSSATQPTARRPPPAR